jgi:hypothetical protein
MENFSITDGVDVYLTVYSTVIGVGQKIIEVQNTKRYSLEEEILSTLHILPLK